MEMVAISAISASCTLISRTPLGLSPAGPSTTGLNTQQGNWAPSVGVRRPQRPQPCKASHVRSRTALIARF